jgi:hypothetical protein
MEAWLRGIAPLFEVQFPMDELRLPRLMTLIRRIKTFAALSPPDQFEGLLHFLKARVCFKQGSSLTTGELYREYAKPLDINRYPRCRFERFLPSAISQTFETVPAHNISRWNEEQKKMTPRRGFNGLAFRNETDASDGMDASDGCLE